MMTKVPLAAFLVFLLLCGCVAIFLLVISEGVIGVPRPSVVVAVVNDDDNTTFEIHDHQQQHQHQQQQRDHHSSSTIITKKPVALLHFGPHKTATTSIQATLANVDEFLKEDKFVYFGHMQTGKYAFNNVSYSTGAMHYLMRCSILEEEEQEQDRHRLSSPCQEEDVEAWEKFSRTIESLFEEGLNVVISDENLHNHGAIHPQILHTLGLAFEKFDRHATVTYRHYSEWMLSQYNQCQKKRVPIEGFVDWHRRSKSDAEFVSLTKEQVDEYSRHFDSVKVFNMHETSSPYGVVVDWLCTILPWAKSTCLKAKSNQLPMLPPKNPSDHSIEARRLAILILIDGGRDVTLYHKTHRDVRKAANAVNTWLKTHEHNASSTGDDLAVPKICLTKDEEDELWRTTIRNRDELVPGYDPSNAMLHERFEKARPQFCQFDYPALVSQQTSPLLREEWEALVSQILEQDTLGHHYADVDWNNLPHNIEQSAMILGYNETTWSNKDVVPAVFAVDCWDDLSHMEQEAAKDLGYTKKIWWQQPCPLPTSKDSSFVVADDVDWNDLPGHLQQAAIALGYNETTWNEDEDTAVSKKAWDDLTSMETVAAREFGYGKKTWDGVAD